MCGRYSLAVGKHDLEKYLLKNYGIELINFEINLPRYNVSPTDKVLSVISDGKYYRVGLLRWGYIPDNANDESKFFINTRSETIDKLPSFKKSFFERRCIILADGFFEWDHIGTTKHPFMFTLKDKQIFGFAGIWTKFINKNQEKIYSTSIITTKANKQVGKIHERMPVILSEEQTKVWLNPSLRDSEALKSILNDNNLDDFEMIEVSTLVNSPQNDNEDVIKPIKKPV
ncbi:MAG: SOS response-associated peptidase [Candidatus Izemoplasmatales bacterium]